jgi:hypothetical protein
MGVAKLKGYVVAGVESQESRTTARFLNACTVTCRLPHPHVHETKYSLSDAYTTAYGTSPGRKTRCTTRFPNAYTATCSHIPTSMTRKTRSRMHIQPLADFHIPASMGPKTRHAGSLCTTRSSPHISIPYIYSVPYHSVTC